LPVGNAGNISAYWMGYKQYGKGQPRVLGAQASGAAPIVTGRAIEKPETIATAIRIGNPARWRQALQALDESDGLITAVTDDQILESWHLLARQEGIFVEPASAAGLAALRQKIESGEVDPAGKRVVVVLTGHGLKDPGTAVDQAELPITLPAKLEALDNYLAQSGGGRTGQAK
jgi:threonine synthase